MIFVHCGLEMLLWQSGLPMIYAPIAHIISMWTKLVWLKEPKAKLHDSFPAQPPLCQLYLSSEHTRREQENNDKNVFVSSTANTICVAQGREIKTNCKSGCSVYQNLCCKAIDHRSAAQAFTIYCGPVNKALNKYKRNLRGERGQPGWQWPSL